MEPPKPVEQTQSKPPAANPAMDVVAPPPPEQDPAESKTSHQSADKNSEAQAPKENKKKPTGPPKPKQPHAPHTGLAIVATVIIVLGLAALATYAYLQTTK